MVNHFISVVVILFSFLSMAFCAAECGKRFYEQNVDELQQWVVGGVLARMGAYPYQVSFHSRDWVHGTSRHVCGGTIISPRWVLTAAHCINNGHSGKYYQVVVGMHDKNVYDNVRKSYSVRGVNIHTKFNGEEGQISGDDIALVHLKDPIEFNDYVQPACLPDQVAADASDLYAPGTRAVISGWGKTESRPIGDKRPLESPDVLHAAAVPLVDWNVCKNANPIYKKEVTESMMCAGNMAGGVSSCQGDSGGPLVKIVNGMATLIGIVSWSAGCAQPNHPGVFTNVTHELEWIRRTMQLFG